MIPAEMNQAEIGNDYQLAGWCSMIRAGPNLPD